MKDLSIVKRQERCWERSTRPFASCVEAYGLLDAVAAEVVEAESVSSVSLVSYQSPTVHVVVEKQDGDDDRQDRGVHERVVEGDLVQQVESSVPCTEDVLTEDEQPMQDVILVETASW